MSAPIVSATMGVMKPLLGKLATLLGDEYKKLQGVRKQASFLIRELSAMKAALEKLELMDELDPVATNWKDHVREMAYDMEDCIDDFIHITLDTNAKAGFVKKNIKRFKALGARHRIADQIEELKALAIEANDRRMRYKIDDCINSTSRVVPVDPRMSAIYMEAAGLVGIDGPKKELVSWLTDTEQKLNVVSIVGFGGLGKTTLAKQVYDEIGGQFSSKAFISVSQRPDMTTFLNGLQLKLGMDGSSGAHEVQDIIDRLREHLTNKRYLIVVDDLWDQSAWNIVSCAFPQNGIRSRVIVTTRVEDVARWACRNRPEYVYRMAALKEKDSKMLFFNRIFGSEDGCPAQFKGVSAEILKRCGGLPLAIVSIASLLASRPTRSMNEWESIRSSLGAKFATKPTLEEMRSILNLSYIHLPLRLRACLLYLGMYPEDREIKKDCLVRQWIAEGFISNSHGLDLEEVANSYFHELINRSLVQPEATLYGEVRSCRVHDMMFDLILSKCAKENFISAAYNYEDMARLHGSEYKVRRLSMTLGANGGTFGTICTALSQGRSFAWFGESKYTPNLLLFKCLRVLVFEFSYKKGTIVDLAAIAQLFQLRYLKAIAHGSGVELPTEIKGLVHLETLEIYGPPNQCIPSDISELPCLSHLIVSARLPEGTRNMKSLRTLRCSGVEESSSEDIKGLGELTNLRALGLNNCKVVEIDALVSSIGKLCKLRYLSLSFWTPKHDDDPLSTLYNPPLHIEELYMQGRLFKRVPQWIGNLDCLRVLALSVEHLSTDEVHVIGKLPSLVHLNLEIMRSFRLCIPEEVSADSAAPIICTGLFPVLESLVLDSDDNNNVASMGFEPGAMPKLRKLTLTLRIMWDGAPPVGMEYLLALEQIQIYNSCTDAENADVESAFRNATRVCPRLPYVTVS